MLNTRAIPLAKLRGALKRFQGHPVKRGKESVKESHHVQLSVEPGVTYPTYVGPLTVLSIADMEVCYFQGGLVYFVDRREFRNLLDSQSIPGVSRAIEISGSRLLSELEVEFVMGIVSTVGPLASWMFLGNDLATFIKEKRQRLRKWTSQVASIFLARMILKTYATILYQRLSGLHADAVWSSLSEEVSTDDRDIFRFTGRLLGHYGSEELVERAISWQQSVFSCVFSGLEELAESGSEVQGKGESGQPTRIKNFVTALGRLGVRISNNDVHALLQVIHCHGNEIMKSIEMIRPEFAEETPTPGSKIWC